MSKTIALKPRLNEKTYGLAERRVYVFDVDASVNKHSIARAVEVQFEVTVSSVNTVNVVGKPKRVISLSGKRYTSTTGSRSDFKKAYVTLAEGHSLPFFDAIEEEEQREQKSQEQFDKALAKEAEKEEKAAKKNAKADKPEKAEAPAKKPAAKPKAAAKPTQDPEEKPAEEERKHGLAAWRGFRLRKKNRGDK